MYLCLQCFDVSFIFKIAGFLAYSGSCLMLSCVYDDAGYVGTAVYFLSWRLHGALRCILGDFLGTENRYILGDLLPCSWDRN
jgi:hypothetical protein